jgi:hypothetical protein
VNASGPLSRFSVVRGDKELVSDADYGIGGVNAFEWDRARVRTLLFCVGCLFRFLALGSSLGPAVPVGTAATGRFP